jgi:4-amino-4-deoxy-L-arabinose transferase-like glycosyltransferase
MIGRVTARPSRPPAAPEAPSSGVRGALAAAATVIVVLTLLSGRYGYHRDELYFAMLPPAWGYVDQPPLMPLLANLLGASPWLLRIPATASAGASVLLIALITRELGGSPRSQVRAAWAYAGTVAVLDFGHVLLTSSLDLVFWPLTCWLVIRAELRGRARLWLAAGAVAGAATYNKLLIAVLLAGIALGFAVAGPRRRLLSPWPVAGAVLAVAIALPNLVYQVVNGLPQLTMGAALSESNAGEVRVFTWVFLVIALGPVLVPVWLAGLRALWTRPQWRPVRFLVPAFGVLVLFTVVGGTQPHYPTFLLGVVFAAGMAARDEQTFARRWQWAVGLNAAVSAVISLPLIPLSLLGATPIPAMNQLIADQVGWPTYAAQIRTAYDALPGAQRVTAVVVTSNYGEAGAVQRFTDLPVYSGQNALHDLGPPPEGTGAVVFVGGQLEVAASLFSECRILTRLDNGVDVANEEQGQPVAACVGPRQPWARLWPQLRHLD